MTRRHSGRRRPIRCHGRPGRTGFSTTPIPVLPLVPRRRIEHLRQRAGPPYRGAGDQAALIYDSPVTNSARTYTYRELRDETARFAGALRDLGVGKGDRVVLYMPMIPETVIAMLACARLGAVHSVVFGGFASHELASRIDDARPRVIVFASCGIEPTRVVEYKPMLDHALRRSRIPLTHASSFNATGIAVISSRAATMTGTI